MATATVAVEPESGIELDDLHRISLDVYRSMGELGLLFPRPVGEPRPSSCRRAPAGHGVASP